MVLFTTLLSFVITTEYNEADSPSPFQEQYFVSHIDFLVFFSFMDVCNTTYILSIVRKCYYSEVTSRKISNFS